MRAIATEHAWFRKKMEDVKLLSLELGPRGCQEKGPGLLPQGSVG